MEQAEKAGPEMWSNFSGAGATSPRLARRPRVRPSAGLPGVFGTRPCATTSALRGARWTGTGDAGDGGSRVPGSADPEPVGRREPPESVEQLLAWAGEPLATQEVAETMGIERDEAAAALERSGAAVAEAVGTDAFWTLAAKPARRAA